MSVTQKNSKVVSCRDFQSKDIYKSSFDLPVLKSITLHISFKEQQFESRKFFLPGAFGLEILSGQKAFTHKSKKAVSVWRLVKGDYTGLSIVLRGNEMYSFFDNLVELVLPSLRPFEGININSLDRQGNLSFTVPNIFVFPQIEREYLHFQQGFNIKGNFGEDFRYLPVDINIYTSSKTIDEGKIFFSAIRVPLVKV